MSPIITVAEHLEERVMGKTKLLLGTSQYQAHLQIALDEAVEAYERTHHAIGHRPRETEETATPQGTLLSHKLERHRATALVLAACCVEALANLYLMHKATPEQFAVLERSKLIEKWVVIPTMFLPDYSLPKGSQLFQDLTRLVACRNALMHLKERVTREDQLLHQGTLPKRGSDEHVFVRRCRTLPEDLLDHLASFDKSDAILHVRSTLLAVLLMREMSQLCPLEEPG